MDNRISIIRNIINGFYERPTSSSVEFEQGYMSGILDTIYEICNGEEDRDGLCNG